MLSTNKPLTPSMIMLSVMAPPDLEYCILSSIVNTFFKENYDEILPAHYTWNAVEKGLKMKWVMWC
jgi:hypothetical protein